MLAAFAAATESGDLDALVRVLAPDVVLTSDSGGHFPAARRPIVGVDPVARFLLGLFTRAGRYGQRLRAEPVLVDGVLGLHLETVAPDGRLLRMVTGFAVHDGRVTGLFHQLNPDKLHRLPELAPDATWPPRW